MKTPFDLDKIYNKLPQEKTELSVEKVELSLMDDYLSLEKKYYKAQDDALDPFDKIEGQLKQMIKSCYAIKPLEEKLNKIAKNIMEQSKELGVKSKVSNNLKEASSYISFAKVIQKFINEAKTVN
jgi:DNA repair ATPase RecN